MFLDNSKTFFVNDIFGANASVSSNRVLKFELLPMLYWGNTIISQTDMY